jgi:acyl-coenzyme A thioesterase PaaI-like protein
MAGDWSSGSRRESPLLPQFRIERSSPDFVCGRVTFTPFHHGGGGFVHGGAIPLLFDQVLGRLTNGPDRGRARTAYLNVNYRMVTPIGSELQLDANVERVERRKMFVTGRLRHGQDLLADAEGLFIVLRSGQP